MLALVSCDGTHNSPVTRTIGEAKVLKVDVGSGEQPTSRIDKCINKLVISITPNSLLAKAQIEWVVEQFFVVCAAVEDDGKCTIGVESRTKRRQHQLGDGDEDTAAALVANPQYLLAI